MKISDPSVDDPSVDDPSADGSVDGASLENDLANDSSDVVIEESYDKSYDESYNIGEFHADDCEYNVKEIDRNTEEVAGNVVVQGRDPDDTKRKPSIVERVAAKWVATKFLKQGEEKSRIQRNDHIDKEREVELKAARNPKTDAIGLKREKPAAHNTRTRKQEKTFSLTCCGITPAVVSQRHEEISVSSFGRRISTESWNWIHFKDRNKRRNALYSETSDSIANSIEEVFEENNDKDEDNQSESIRDDQSEDQSDDDNRNKARAAGLFERHWNEGATGKGGVADMLESQNLVTLCLKAISSERVTAILRICVLIYGYFKDKEFFPKHCCYLCCGGQRKRRGRVRGKSRKKIIKESLKMMVKVLSLILAIVGSLFLGFFLAI